MPEDSVAAKLILIRRRNIYYRSYSAVSRKEESGKEVGQKAQRRNNEWRDG